MATKARELGEFATAVENVGTSFVQFNRDIVATGGTIGGNTIATTNSLPTLGTDYVDSGQVISIIDSNYVQARAPAGGIDSAAATTIADGNSLLNALIFGG